MSEYKIIEANEIKPGQIQHEKLSEEWYNEALSIYKLIAEVEGGSFEIFEENFRRDTFYEKEITIWRCIATAYFNFVSARMTISFPEKKAAYDIALFSSMLADNESTIEGNEFISDDDTKFIYSTFRNMISQTYANRRNDI